MTIAFPVNCQPSLHKTVVPNIVPDIHSLHFPHFPKCQRPTHIDKVTSDPAIARTCIDQLGGQRDSWRPLWTCHMTVMSRLKRPPFVLHGDSEEIEGDVVSRQYFDVYKSVTILAGPPCGKNAYQQHYNNFLSLRWLSYCLLFSGNFRNYEKSLKIYHMRLLWYSVKPDTTFFAHMVELSAMWSNETRKNNKTSYAGSRHFAWGIRLTPSPSAVSIIKIISFVLADVCVFLEQFHMWHNALFHCPSAQLP